MTDTELHRALTKLKRRKETAALQMLKAYRKYIVANKEWERLVRENLAPRTTCKGTRRTSGGQQ